MERKVKVDSKVNVVKEIKLIYIEVQKGDGTDENPIRIAKQYWTLDGRFLFEEDTLNNRVS